MLAVEAEELTLLAEGQLAQEALVGVETQELLAEEMGQQELPTQAEAVEEVQETM